MRCSNTAFYVYLKKISSNWGKFSSTALVLEILCITISHFYAISCDQKTGLTIFWEKTEIDLFYLPMNM